MSNEAICKVNQYRITALNYANDNNMLNVALIIMGRLTSDDTKAIASGGASASASGGVSISALTSDGVSASTEESQTKSTQWRFCSLI